MTVPSAASRQVAAKELYRDAVAGVRFWKISERRSARGEAERAAGREADRRHTGILVAAQLEQLEIDRHWAALSEHDPAAVIEAVDSAFSDNASDSVCVDAATEFIGGAPVHYVTAVVQHAGVTLIPEQRPDVTPGGKPTLRKRAKTDRNALCARAIAVTVLATAKEALAAAPRATEVRILVVRRADRGGGLEPVLAGRYTRTYLDRSSGHGVRTPSWSHSTVTTSCFAPRARPVKSFPLWCREVRRPQSSSMRSTKQCRATARSSTSCPAATPQGYQTKGTRREQCSTTGGELLQVQRGHLAGIAGRPLPDPGPGAVGGWGMDTVDDNELDAFWAISREHAQLSGIPTYMGANPMKTLRPPAWSFGATPEQSDQLLGLVLDGTKTATSSARTDYADEGEPLPEPGMLSIVLDGAGRPRALVVTTEARVVPFDQVDADHARDEGEGDGSLEYWREAHERFFTEHAEGGFTKDMPVVLERFRVLYPTT